MSIFGLPTTAEIDQVELLLLSRAYIRRKSFEADLLANKIAAEILGGLGNAFSSSKHSKSVQKQPSPKPYKGSVVSLLDEMSKPLG